MAVTVEHNAFAEVKFSTPLLDKGVSKEWGFSTTYTNLLIERKQSLSM